MTIGYRLGPLGFLAHPELTRASCRGRDDVYVYRFDHRPPFPADSIYADWAQPHYVELWYVFDHLDQQPWAVDPCGPAAGAA